MTNLAFLRFWARFSGLGRWVLPCGLWAVQAVWAQTPAPMLPEPLRVVSDNNYPPFLFVDAQGQTRGYVADWWALWSEKTGVPVQLEALAWSEAQRRLQAGEADVIDLIFRTPPREPLYDFGPPHSQVPVAVYEHHTLTGLTDVGSLRGFQVGVMAGDACIDMLKAQGIDSFRFYPSYADVIDGARVNDIKLFCMDEYPAHHYLYRQDLHQVYRKSFGLYEGQFHRAVKKGNAPVLTQVAQGAALISQAEDQALRQRWIQTLEATRPINLWWVGVPAAVVMLLLLAGFGWMRSLRVLVAARTAELQATQAALAERVKEQRCLYEVFRVTEALETPLVTMTQHVAEALPGGWQHPAVARVELDCVVQTQGPWKHAITQLSAPVMVNGQRRGEVSVGYTQSHPMADEGTFLAEERALLNTVVERLAGVLQRRDLAQAMRKRESIFYAIVDQAADSMAVIDADTGQFIEFNDAACRNLGHGRAEFEQMSVFDIDAAMSRDDILQAFVRLASAGTAVFETVHRHKSGALRDVRISNRHLSLEGREMFVSIWADITEIKQQQRELEAYRDKLAALVAERTAELQAILDAASVGIFLLDGRRVLRCNRTLEHILGFTMAETVGQTTRAWYPDGASFDAVGQQIQADLVSQGFFQTERPLRRKDGQVIWAKLAARPIDPSDPSKGLAGMVEDISAERLALEQVQHARQMAEEATRAKSEFLANMSHEIRTPMNAIIGMSHLALRTGLDERQRGYVEKVHRAGKHLLGIINDILDFSKIEAGKLKTEATPFRLDQLVEDVLSLLAQRAEEKGLELLVDASARLPVALVGDPLRLKQVIINLLNNAIKFTPAGEVVLRVSELAQADQRVRLHFSVRDTGIGLTAEQKERLFSPFSQGDSSTTRRFGGTGLGLAISRSLVELMGGHIEMDSQPGVGSTFAFDVWLGLQPAGASAARMLTALELAGRRTLVVDDNPAALEVLCEMARSLGLAASAAASGVDALRMLKEAKASGQPVELLLTDWQMPEMDGLQLIAQATQQATAPGVAVVMVTAYAREEARQQATRMGVQLRHVVNKPVTPSSLLEAIGRALQSSAPAPLPMPTAGAQQPNFATLRGKRVLLVEDNDLNQELALELLGEAGMSVVVANHGQEALDRMAAGERFDLVLMDCQMPVMDGYEATRRLRANPDWAHLPVIAMTANAMSGDRDKVLAAGMNDHITKPIDVQHMYEVLAHWLQTGTQPPTASTPGHTSVAGDPRWALPGIDASAGVKTANGNVALFHRLLHRFMEGQGSFATDFDAALQNNDLVTAQRCAHTLKSSAAYVGAHGVRAAAEALEAAVRRVISEGSQGYRPHLQPPLDAVVHELAPVLEGLRLWALSHEGSPPVPDPDPAAAERAASNLRHLRALLTEGDPDCLDLWQAHEASFKEALPNAHKRIAAAMQSYDFDQALALLGPDQPEN